jgi:lysine 2,3-aminomutase
MSQSEQRTGVVPNPLATVATGFDDEEPPGRPRRHPIWNKIPNHQWDDWRWQSRNAIRSVRQLRDLLPFSEDELEAMAPWKPSSNSPFHPITSR